MYELRTEIEIDATAETVWAILSDFAAYPQWNPFIVELKGAERPELGAKLDVQLVPAGGKGMRFTPSIVECAPGRGFAWLGRLMVPGLFDGEHRYELAPAPDGRVRFVHSERFSGVLVPFLKKMLDGPTRQGFEAMNQALKARAERVSAT